MGWLHLERHRIEKRYSESGEFRSVGSAFVGVRAVLTEAGSILLCGIAIVASGFMLWRSDRKKAAVGRRYGPSRKIRLPRLETDVH